MAKKRYRISVILCLCLVALILLMNVVQGFLISSFTKKSTAESYAMDCTQITNAYSLAIANKISEYMNQMSFYSDADVVSSRDDEKIVKWVGNNFQYTIEAIIINLLNLYGISYEKPSILHKDQKRLFLKSQILFSLVDSGKRIGYVIGDTPLSLSKLRENWRKAYTTVDYIKIFVLYEKPNLKNEWIDTLINTGNRIECEEDNSYIQFYYLEDLFVSLFGNNEYDKFRVALNRFNEKTKHMIGYETIVTTTEDSIRIFKDKCSLLLRDFDYNTILPSSISDAERKMLRRNYIDNGIYRAMTGNSDFADSFISSEWLYNIHQTTNAID